MPQQRKRTGENIHIVRDCAEGNISYAEAAERCGVVFETMRRWTSRYCAEGSAAFLSPQRNRVYSPAQKEAAVKAYLSGEGSMQKICEKYKICSDHQLRVWIKVYNGHKDFKKQTGGSRMTKGRETTQAERLAVANHCHAFLIVPCVNIFPHPIAKGLELHTAAGPFLCRHVNILLFSFGFTLH